MGKDTRIEWTHHTFNPWWGCVRVSDACDHCYAETWAKRLGEDVWGAKSERRFFGDAHWKEPLKWDREAKESKTRRRVFCASMADVFENRKDLVPHRLRLLDLIAATPHLDWLLLTKRIHLVRKQLPKGYELPSNVWLGATVENQDAAGKRLKYLLEFDTPAVRFLSCEPLLGPLDLRQWLKVGEGGTRVDWVIVGTPVSVSGVGIGAWLASVRSSVAGAGAGGVTATGPVVPRRAARGSVVQAEPRLGFGSFTSRMMSGVVSREASGPVRTLPAGCATGGVTGSVM